MDIEKISVGGNEYDVCDATARAMNSDEFSTAASYTAGDYCIYNNTLYKFTAAKSAGAWDSSKVAATQIGDELSQLNSNLRQHKILTYTLSMNFTNGFCRYSRDLSQELSNIRFVSVMINAQDFPIACSLTNGSIVNVSIAISAPLNPDLSGEYNVTIMYVGIGK